jgi:hypothetical protein
MLRSVLLDILECHACHLPTTRYPLIPAEKTLIAEAFLTCLHTFTTLRKRSVAFQAPSSTIVTWLGMGINTGHVDAKLSMKLSAISYESWRVEFGTGQLQCSQ